MFRRVLAVAATLISALALTAEADTTGASDVVVIGVPGLRWADLSQAGSPVLWRMAREGSIASLSVRTVGSWTCPVDGWLTVSAGTRAAYPRIPCGQSPGDPERWGDIWYAPMAAGARQINLKSDFRAAVGSLGDAVHRAGASVAAIGPGAALAAADSTGGLDAYAPAPETFRGWGRYRVTIVDLENGAG